MPQSYFELPFEEKQQLLNGAAERLGLPAKIVEKDIWVCWTLNALFSMENAPQFVFKGGTCLSKVYDVIRRFSEDVDITINPDHPDIKPGFDPIDLNVGKSKLKKIGREVENTLMPRYVQEKLEPYFERFATSLPENQRPVILFEESNSLRVNYPTSLPDSPSFLYMKESVLIELGSRATINPREPVRVFTYLEQEFPELQEKVMLPFADVQVLDVDRIFWEKATLIHHEITRSNRKTRERYARHWYDLYQLANHPVIGIRARNNTDVRDYVIHFKSVHFKSAGVDLNCCRTGHLQLIPEGVHLQELEEDFQQMQTVGMFIEEPPSFKEIIDGLKVLESYINTKAQMS